MDSLNNDPIDSPSIGAKLVYIFFGLIQFKKIFEKNVSEDRFPKKPALPPKSFLKNFSMQEFQINNRKIWLISPKDKNSEVIILYLHGGAYVANITKQHWIFIKKLLEKIKAIIIVPDYPLAPEFHCNDVYNFIWNLYLEIFKKFDNKRIIFIGDSAGGGLALGFTQFLKSNQQKQPEQIILISPWLDATMSNPDIRKIENKDKILSIKGLKIAGKKYAGNLDLTDYKVSPIYGNFNGLGKISIFTGTYDILNPDAKKFKQLLEKSNIEFNYFEYSKLFHDWIIISSLKESKDVINKIYKLVRN